MLSPKNKKCLLVFCESYFNKYVLKMDCIEKKTLQKLKFTLELRVSIFSTWWPILCQVYGESKPWKPLFSSASLMHVMQQVLGWLCACVYVCVWVITIHLFPSGMLFWIALRSGWQVLTKCECLCVCTHVHAPTFMHVCLVWWMLQIIAAGLHWGERARPSHFILKQTHLPSEEWME